MKLSLLPLIFSFAVVASNKPHSGNSGAFSSEVMTLAADGTKVYGQKYFGELDNKTPLILMFHQAGSNGRGEYADLIPWLNASGFRAIAWDQRSGGTRYGSENRTVNKLNPDKKYTYCDASADLQAALGYVIKENLAEKVVVWGSSYSAALVFKLAAENNNYVSGVAAFSPASGGPMSECKASLWLDQVSVPVIVFRPDSEMTRESSIEQRDIFNAAGVSFNVIENGVHGSSMLVGSRTENKMQKARSIVEKWLKSLE